MSAEDNKRHIVEMWKAFRSGDETRIAGFFHADALWTAQPRNATAVALGAPDGFANARDIARFIASDFRKLFCADAATEFRAIHADGNIVIVESTLRATLVNGRQYDNEYCFIFALEDGRVRTMREYMDTAKGYWQIFGEEAGARFDAAFGGAE